jgi:hypothetical protein
MSKLDGRVNQLEKQSQPTEDVPAWAEIIGSGRAVLCYQDGRRVEVNEDEVPHDLKTYDGFSPDDWDQVKP